MVINYEIAYYLGFLAADGWVIDNRLGFALKREDKESVEYIANITSKLCGKNIEIERGGKYDYCNYFRCTNEYTGDF